MTRVAFQGVAGAYSEETTRQYFGPAVGSIPYRTLEDVFPAVENGEVDCAMVPVENAVAGSVSRSYELLMERDLRICAETILHVHHMLLAVPGTWLADLECVRSRPQALAQCQRYLSRYELKPEPAFDTASSARDLPANTEPGVDAI